MLGILFAGIAPGLALLSYFYLKDKYEPEPLSLVFKMFILGALLVFPIMFIEYIIDIENLINSNFIKSFITVGLLEEFFKWFILIYTVYHHVEFDEPYDGIVYGVTASVGFATAENIMYLVTNGIGVAIGRALLPVSIHALLGVIMGYYLGKGKFIASIRRRCLTFSILIPSILHGTYDFIINSFVNWLLIIVPFMAFLWWLALLKVKSASSIVPREEIYDKTIRYKQIN